MRGTAKDAGRSAELTRSGASKHGAAASKSSALDHSALMNSASDSAAPVHGVPARKMLRGKSGAEEVVIMIHLLECRGLKVDVSTARRTGFEPNPFAEITVFGERRLTEIESTTSSVLWDRQFVFRSTCTPYEFNRAELSIKLWHANVVLRDELIGQVGTLLSPRAAIPSLPSLLTPTLYTLYSHLPAVHVWRREGQQDHTNALR